MPRSRGTGGKPPKRPIEQYEHKNKQRMNNPPAGLVTAETDPPLPTHKTYDYVTPVPSVPELVARSAHLAVLEGINDHENLGGLFRNAAALRVDAVLLGPGCADPLYRRSVRVSMGHVLLVPFAPLRRWPADLQVLRAAGFRIVALTPAADATPLAQAGVATGRVAWVLGAEGPGLSAAALDAADLVVRIPMVPGVDSLNVATAAAIAFAGAGRV